MQLPADSHVHSEWSWDTGGPDSEAKGRMRQACERAMKIGLPAIAFTEHFDLDTAWATTTEDLMPHQRFLLGADGIMHLPRWDVEGYLADLEEHRQLFPDLVILSGAEFGQPHLHEAEAARLIDLSTLDRVNGSLHTLPNGATRSEPNTLFHLWPADRVMDVYLDEIPRMVANSSAFHIFTHIDYAVRAWPVADVGPFDPRRFEEGFREAMRALADSGRALELNTRRLWPWIPQRWVQEGGQLISFGSDAHVPAEVGSGFAEAVMMAEHFGFRPGRRPQDLWSRSV